MGLFNIIRWPTIAIFVLAGAAAIGFAFMSVNLVGQAMANRDFVREYGWLAVEHGAVLQMMQLAGWGSIALLCWVTFKICEQALEDRYFAWARRQKARAKAAASKDAAPE